jgi:hypothetical protein
MLEIIVLVISDVNAFISKENIARINKNEDENYPELDNTITYQMLYDSRAVLGSERGYFEHKEGVKFYIIPYVKDRVIIDPLSTVITEYSLEDYEEQILPFWDKK